MKRSLEGLKSHLSSGGARRLSERPLPQAVDDSDVLAFRCRLRSMSKDEIYGEMQFLDMDKEILFLVECFAEIQRRRLALETNSLKLLLMTSKKSK